MLRSELAKDLENEVLEAIEELYNKCIDEQIRDNEFLLYLVNGHYYERMAQNGRNPYIIGMGMEGAKDMGRMKFVHTYIDISFEQRLNEARNQQERFEVREEAASLSMMVYTHFWESKVFLKRLRHLAILCQGNSYDWNLVCRPRNTYEFIRDDIRGIYETENLQIFDMLRRTYRSQLRNAFAHSDYHITHDRVYLDNYNPRDQYTIEYLTHDQFDEIITLTILIHHALMSKTDEFSQRIGEEQPIRNIYVPENSGVWRSLQYNPRNPQLNWTWI